MAFGKPLIVQGERGFWELLTPDTAPVFLRQGLVRHRLRRRATVDASTARLEKILRGAAG